MKINPSVPGGILLLAIGYKYNFRKVLGFISIEGAGINEPGDPYLSCFPDIYYNVDVLPAVFPHFLGRYFNACNAIDNKNRMNQPNIALVKYWVTQSVYFRLATTVALGMGVTDGKLLLCHGISQDSDYKNISTLEYNDRTIYDCFNNPFTDEFGIPALNLPQIKIDDRPHPHKIARYTSDMIPVAISVTSEHPVSPLTTPSNLE